MKPRCVNTSIRIGSAFFLAGSSLLFAASCETLKVPQVQITKAESVDGACRVTLTVSEIKIEVWMPVEGWNGRLLGTGNGGFAGKISTSALANGVKRGYAVANTDMGMSVPEGSDASIFTGHPERWADWGYHATHEMAVQSRKVIKAFYGQDARKTYFSGCSTGGEQALMEAQRYPDDYDGIIGGAPANNRTGVHMSILWNYATTQQAYLSAAKLKLLHDAVLETCDALDGVKDGVVRDPRACPFDPKSVPGLTPAEIETAQKLYAGPGKLYPGVPKGSELDWRSLGPAPGTPGNPPFEPIFKWVFGNNWNWRSFDFDQSASKFEKALGAPLNATNPDLSRFRSLGHKLIQYHGWADWLVVPQESINYYNAVQSKMGKQEADKFYRLFMIPGMAHCGGGVGTDNFDMLAPLVDWVEQNKAPELIVAQRSKGTPMQRPLCPHPLVATYRGTGSTDEAASFTCAAPR